MRDRNATLVALLCAVAASATACSDAPHDPKGDGGVDVITEPKPD